MNTLNANANPSVGAAIVELPVGKAVADSKRSLHLPREGTLWLLAALVMFIAGLFKGINLLILLAYLLMGLWLVNLRLVERDLRRLRGRRLTHELFQAGVPGDIQFEIAIRGSSPGRGVTIEDRERRWMILNLPGEMPQRFRYAHAFMRRGIHVIPPLRARSSFPFGLVGRSVELAPAEEQIVLPRRGKIHLEVLQQWLQRQSRGDGRARVRHPRAALQEADVSGLRLFRTGDSPRWIHWRSSARRNQLLVREFESNDAPSLCLIVDPWLPAGATLKDRELLESTISLAATVCYDWSRDLVTHLSVVVAGRSPAVLPAGNGLDFARRALELLAVEEGIATEPTWNPIEHLPHTVASMPILVLSSRSGSPLVGAIAATTGQPPAVVEPGDTPAWYQPPLPGPVS